MDENYCRLGRINDELRRDSPQEGIYRTDDDFRRWIKNFNLGMKFKDGEFDIGRFLTKLMDSGFFDTDQFRNLYALKHPLDTMALLVYQGYVTRVDIRSLLKSYKNLTSRQGIAEYELLVKNLYKTYLLVYKDLDTIGFSDERLKDLSLALALHDVLECILSNRNKLDVRVTRESSVDDLYANLAPRACDYYRWRLEEFK